MVQRRLVRHSVLGVECWVMSSYLIVVCKTLGIGVLMFLDWSGAGGGMGGIVFRVQGIGERPMSGILVGCAKGRWGAAWRSVDGWVDGGRFAPRSPHKNTPPRRSPASQGDRSPFRVGDDGLSPARRETLWQPPAVGRRARVARRQVFVSVTSGAIKMSCVKPRLGEG